MQVVFLLLELSTAQADASRRGTANSGSAWCVVPGVRAAHLLGSSSRTSRDSPTATTLHLAVNICNRANAGSLRAQGGRVHHPALRQALSMVLGTRSTALITPLMHLICHSPVPRAVATGSRAGRDLIQIDLPVHKEGLLGSHTEWWQCRASVEN